MVTHNRDVRYSSTHSELLPDCTSVLLDYAETLTLSSQGSSTKPEHQATASQGTVKQRGQLSGDSSYLLDDRLSY